MKAVHRLAPVLAISLALPACVSAPAEPAPAPVPAPVARPAPAPAPAPVPQAPISDNWMDIPATPGAWRYTVSASTIGPYTTAAFIAADGQDVFAVVCAFGNNIGLRRTVRTNRNLAMTIRTETATVTRLVAPDPEGQPFVNAVFRPSDPLLDAMALSKGRFAVEVEGEAPLYLPSWAEVSRVIEDCR